MDPSHQSEHNRAPRVSARFFVRVLGVDARATLRAGNISMTGAYFETDTAPGEVGQVERIEVKSMDGSASVVVPAVIIRLSHTRDLWAGEQVVATAWQFLPDNEEVNQAIGLLVRDIAASALAASDGTIEGGRLPASVDVDVGGAVTAQIRSLEPNGVSLLTSWPVEAGARVHITINERGDVDPVSIDGVVESNQVVEPGRTFRIDVRTTGDTQGSRHHAHAVTKMVDAIVSRESERSLRAASALAGDLSRVPLTSVLAFIEWEQWTGALSLHRADDHAKLLFALGRPVDIAASFGARTPQLALRTVLTWNDGRFSLALDPGAATVDDVMQTTVRALLLDLAREDDENTH
jgi:hypothetical protein